MFSIQSRKILKKLNNVLDFFLDFLALQGKMFSRRLDLRRVEAFTVCLADNTRCRAFHEQARESGIRFYRLVMMVSSTKETLEDSLEECKANHSKRISDMPLPFLVWDEQACYYFMLKRIRALTPEFSEYSLLAVDDGCISADPPEVILVTDAADFEEDADGPPKLKVGRALVEGIVGDALLIEMRILTPNEVFAGPRFACR